MAGESTFSAKQIANRIGTEPKTLRKFFRDPKSGYKAVGQGGRYDFPPEELPKIKEAFDAWNKGKTKRNRPTNAERELAKKTGLIPTPRQTPEEDEEPKPRRRRVTNGTPASPLDEDDLLTRCRMTIGQRAAARGVTTDKQGRWVPTLQPRPKKLLTIDEAEALVPGLAEARKKADKAWEERKHNAGGTQTEEDEE